MINSQLLILMLITSAIIILVTSFVKRVTLLEGIISLSICNVFLILIWSITINFIIKDEYYLYHKIKSVEVEISTLEKNIQCNCVDGVCEQCISKSYVHNYFVYTNNDKFLIDSKVMNTDVISVPDSIDSSYKVNSIFVETKPFRNIYSNLDVFNFNNSFSHKRNRNQLYINATEFNKFNDKEFNYNLIQSSITNNTNVYVILTNPEISTHDILYAWNGLKLNEILIHLTVNNGDVLLSSINTWGNSINNKVFIKVFNEKLHQTNLSNFKTLSSNINSSIAMFKQPSDQIFNSNIQNIKPKLGYIFFIMVLSLMLTFTILYFMYRYESMNENARFDYN